MKKQVLGLVVAGVVCLVSAAPGLGQAVSAPAAPQVTSPRQQFGFDIRADSLLWAIVGGIVIGIVSTALSLFVPRRHD